MKYKIILLFFLTSCINNIYTDKKSFTYTAKGFALIENQSPNNDGNIFFVSHNKLKQGTKIRISNPANKVSIEAVIKKKDVYDSFYKALSTGEIAEKLKLDLSFPFVEVTEIKKNKSFIAEKAITQNIEKNIANKAPIESININNLSKKKKKVLVKKKSYSILVAVFYNQESLEILKKRLVTILASSNYQLIYMNKKNVKSYELLMGPYNTINKLKNDYTNLSNAGFEDLDIIIND